MIAHRPAETLPHNLLKIRLRMLTQRADEIIRQFFSDPLVTTDHASPYRLALRSSSYCLGLGFDVVLVVLVCTRRSIRKHCHKRGSAQEQRV